jgi:hemolysin III
MGATASLIYGICMVGLYAMSSIYHGLRPGLGKKVLQILELRCRLWAKLMR